MGAAADILLPVLLCGGAGTRLWPLSREFEPKPLLRLPDGQNLLQKTCLRALALPGVDALLTVTRRDLADAVAQAYAEVGCSARADTMLLEPCARNTAPALAAAALWAQQGLGPATQLLVLAADHLVNDEAAFAQAVDQAKLLAAGGDLVTFGIAPQRAETGYGYIAHDGDRVLRFVEKPELAVARKLAADGRHLWNSGMLCVRVDAALREFAAHAPQVLDAVTSALPESPLPARVELDAARFTRAPVLSIDHALLERSSRVRVVACDIGWSDIGCWNSLGALQPADSGGNRVQGEAMLQDARNCYVRSPNRLAALVGVDDLVVVDTADALLVAHRDAVQEVRRVATALRSSGHEAALRHREVHRPWGSYRVLEQGQRFKIKRIVVRPGCQLSLQMHHHRSEHWVVVSGTARVVNGHGTSLVHSNESTYIRVGEVHRLGNPGVIDLVLIEVQCGDYLGEDDILRLQDDYGRDATATSAPMDKHATGPRA